MGAEFARVQTEDIVLVNAVDVDMGSKAIPPQSLRLRMTRLLKPFKYTVEWILPVHWTRLLTMFL